MTHTVSTCVVCGATTDQFLCGDDRTGSGCLGTLVRDLGDCAALVDELNTTLARQDRLGGASVGYVSNGGDEQPLPLNAGAMESGLLLRDRLASWCRALWEDNAAREDDGSVPPLDLDPGILSTSRWLMRHPTWIALCAAADELVDELRETIRQAWRSVDSAPGRVYIGTCSAPLEDESGESCHEELYARAGDWEKRCPVCLTLHDVRERQAGLSDAVRHQYVPQRVLIGIVTGRGIHLSTSAFRNLRARGRIVAWVRVQDGDDGASVTDRYGWRVRVRTVEDCDLPDLYHVGSVLDVVTTGKYARTGVAA